MNASNNNVNLSFSSYTETRDTEISVDLRGENMDEGRLQKLLNTWLIAIDCDGIEVVKK